MKDNNFSSNDKMTSKEFDLLLSFIIELLEDGKVDKVLELLKANKNDIDNNDKNK